MSVDSDSDYIHEATGVNFPLKIGHFLRTQVDALDSKQLSIVTTYVSANPMYAASIRVYLYPIPVVDESGKPIWVDADEREQLLDDHFKNSVRQFRKEEAGEKFVSATVIFIAQRLGTVEADKFEYVCRNSLNEKKIPFSCSLYFVPLANWLLVYRVDYPISDSVDASPEIENFMRFLDLPKSHSGIGPIAFGQRTGRALCVS